MSASQRVSRGFHRLAFFALSILALALHSIAARAEFWTYSEWRAASVNARSTYIAGAIDSLIAFSVKPMIRHMRCIMPVAWATQE
jgi:hypothetical protein